MAAGTVFLDVLIWRAQLGLSSAVRQGSAPEHSSHAPLYCLKGHEGSIHRRASSGLSHTKRGFAYSAHFQWTTEAMTAVWQGALGA